MHGRRKRRALRAPSAAIASGGPHAFFGAPHAFSKWRRFVRDRDGVVATEFAIAATVAIALVFAAIDVGRLYIINGLLGDAARVISRENQVQLGRLYGRRVQRVGGRDPRRPSRGHDGP